MAQREIASLRGEYVHQRSLLNRGDVFRTDVQHARLQELKSRRDTLSELEREELEHLVELEFDATTVRARSIPLVKS